MRYTALVLTLALLLAAPVSGGEAFLNRQMKGSPLTSQQGDDLFSPEYTQASHGFSVGDVVRRSGGSTHTKAQANSAANVGRGLSIVVSSASSTLFSAMRATNSHSVTFTGHGLGAYGTKLWLSQGTAGLITATEPTTGIKVYLGYVISANVIHWEPEIGGVTDGGMVISSATPSLTIDDTDQAADWLFDTLGSDDFQLAYSTREKLLIDDTGGYAALGFDLSGYTLNRTLSLVHSGPTLGFVPTSGNASSIFWRSTNDAGQLWEIYGDDTVWYLEDDSGSDRIIEVSDDALNDSLRIADSVGGEARVGIGVDAPSEALHVVGSARVTDLVSCDTIDTDAAGLMTCGTDGGGGGGDPVLVDTVAIVDAAGVDLTSGVGVDITLAAGPTPDTATFSFDETEINGATWGDATQATMSWAWNLSAGTDPGLTLSSDLFNFANNISVDTTDAADAGAIRLNNAAVIAWEAAPAGTDVTMGADSSEVIQITGGTLDAADLSGSVPDASIAQTSVTQHEAALSIGGAQVDSGTVPVARVGAAHIDAITEVAAALKTGADLEFVTGTAGATDDCAKWNVDGDLVTAGASCAGAPAFSDITGAANTTAAMTVGTGASIGVSGSGTIAATTANALFSNPPNCLSGGLAGGVTAAGNAEDCVAKTGADTTWVSGTAGATDECAKWNVDGDLVTHGGACGGSPGADSIGTSELDDGADTPLAGEWVQVDPGDTSQFNYRTDAELLSDVGAVAGAHTTVGTSGVLQKSDGSDLVDSLLTESGSAIGFNQGSPDGAGLHIHSATAGAVSAGADADELVLEGSGATGLSFLSPAGSYGQMLWASPTDATSAFIRHKTTGALLELGTTTAGGQIWMFTGDGVQAVTIDAGQGLTMHDQGIIRLREGTGGGLNWLGFQAPATVTSNQTCTWEDDASFIPDSCVGDGTDGTGTDTLDDLSDDLPTALSNVTTITNTQFCVGNAGGGFDCTTAGALADDDLSDDNPTALSGVTTMTDGSFCQGNASTGFDCDVATIDEADLDANVVLDNASNTYSTGTQNFSSATAVTFAANEIVSTEIATIVETIPWPAGSFSADGTNCADPAEVTLNSGPKQYTVVCTNNLSSTIYGSVAMPKGWDGGTVNFTLYYVQTAADTADLNGDVAAQCRGAGETVSSTWGTEIAIDDAAVTGSNGSDLTTSAAVTPAGTCAGQDKLWWRYQVDTTTSTAMATLHFTDMTMTFTSNVGDE